MKARRRRNLLFIAISICLFILGAPFASSVIAHAVEPPGRADPATCNASREAAYTFGYKIGEQEREIKNYLARRLYRDALRESSDIETRLQMCAATVRDVPTLQLTIAEAQVWQSEATEKLGDRDRASVLYGGARSTLDAMSNDSLNAQQRDKKRDLIERVKHGMMSISP